MDTKQIPLILICSAAWKESLTSTGANRLIAEEIGRHHPDWTIRTLPFSDGGDGWLEAVESLFKSSVTEDYLTVTGPLPDQTVEARYLIDTHSQRVYLEAAEVHGMRRLLNGQRDVMRATSYGVGEAVRLLIERYPGLQEIVISVGGSASVDGGIGFLQGLGWHVHTTSGTTLSIPAAGSHLCQIAALSPPSKYTPSQPEMTVILDVETRYLDAPRIFGPQKGATETDVTELTCGFKQVVPQLNPSVMDALGMGAAGGLPAGILTAFPQARIEMGTAWFGRESGLDALWQQADLIISGEGRVDATSLLGKGTGYLIQKASQSKKPLGLYCGQSTLREADTPWVQIFPVTDNPPDPLTQSWIEETPERLRQTISASISTIEQRLEGPPV